MASISKKQLKKLKAATGGDPELFRRVMAKASQVANDPSVRKIASRMAKNKSKKNIDINDIKDSILNDGKMLNRMGLPSRPSNFPEAPPEATQLFESMASGSRSGDDKPVEKLEPCVVCQIPGNVKCKKCYTVFYCSKKCLKADQKKHKKQCGKLANQYYANLDNETKLKARLEEIEARDEAKDDAGNVDRTEDGDEDDDEEIMNALNGKDEDCDDDEEESGDDEEIRDMMNGDEESGDDDK